jgi:hypothetical protein
MQMSSFYSFRWAQAKNEILIEPTIEYDDRELFYGRLTIEEPFETKVGEGKKLYDIAHFEDPFNFSISEKVHRLLKDAAATGWKIYEISIKGIDKKYFGFLVTGKCGPLKRPATAGFVQGVEFEIETWDGSDFFCAEGTLGVMCTERIKDILIKNKITNLKLGRIDTIQWYST